MQAILDACTRLRDRFLFSLIHESGVRIEELTELSHHSFVQYTLPSTGELVPLLHIAPSKTDTERLLVISPELADVLSAIVCRIRDTNGAVPLVIAYDRLERAWNPPAPLLFQRRLRVENRPVTQAAIRDLLKRAVADAGITDAKGQPLVFAPHDLRRIWVTDAVTNGMPPHIAQLVCGHKDINTTMGYKAVYPEEVINGHRAFIARRRVDIFRRSDAAGRHVDEAIAAGAKGGVYAARGDRRGRSRSWSRCRPGRGDGPMPGDRTGPERDERCDMSERVRFYFDPVCPCSTPSARGVTRRHAG